MDQPSCIALAFARPKMMRRVIHTCGQFGIEHVVLFRSYLCEKGYELSHFYDPDSLMSIYSEGTSQTGVSCSPCFEFFDGFKPFIEDFAIYNFNRRDVGFLDPDGEVSNISNQKALLVFGPERGFTDRERQLIKVYGFQELQFGPLHLRLETAVPFVLGAVTSFS